MVQSDKEKAIMASLNGNSGSKTRIRKKQITQTKVPVVVPRKFRAKEETKTEEKIESIQVKGVTFHDGDDADIKYKINEHGNVEYTGGFGAVLKKLGGRKLNQREIVAMMKREDWNADSPDQKIADQVYDFLQEKHDNNTYNASSAISSDLDYGFFKDDKGRTFLSFKSHLGEDARGNYTDNELFDVTDIDLGITGEPEGDLGTLLYPEMMMIFSWKGDTYDIRVDGGMHGYYDISTEDGVSLNENTKKEIGGEYDVNFEKAFNDYVENHFKK